jgi:hypothetical protein
VDILEALALVDSVEFDLPFIVNATPVSDVRNLAEKVIRLSEKPLSFF